MLINANSTTNRTKILTDNYFQLLQKGIDSEKILVLVQNSKKKKEFISEIKARSKKGNIGSLKIYSFYGLIYNYILENWAEVENSIKSDTNRKILPNLCGLEVSQHILKECIKEVDFSGYNSKVSLLHQLLRRNSLITINDLSNEEVDFRTKILIESYSSEAKTALNKYKAKSISLRAFDYIRQINIFQMLYKKLDNNFEYVFVDDADEITPCVLSYLTHIKPTVKEFFIGYDSFGSTRLGYLGAINVDFEKFLGEKSLELPENSKTKTAKTILTSVKEEKLIDLENINSKSYLRRNEMLKGVIDDIKLLLKQGVSPQEIAVITPLADDLLKTYFEKNETPNLKFNFLSKNEKLNQNKLIGYILELLKIINNKINVLVSPYVLKGILIELLKFDNVEAVKFTQEYKTKYEMDSTNIFDLMRTKENPEFQKFIELFEKIKDEKLSFQLTQIAESYVNFNKNNSKNIIKLNQLLKQVYDFEEVFKSTVSNLELLNQLENTIISENPLADDEIETDSIVVSTAQKIIDYSYKTKYCFLLDTQSEAWLKNDIGPLYNAWVMQKKWDKETFEIEDNINLTLDRTARIIYKLFLLSDNFTLYSSAYDSLGSENFFGIDKYFKYKNDLISDKKAAKPIIPRDDQKEVLNYKGGLMSVSATAGSGKTTIMLLLVDKILSGEVLDNIEPKNIFVLTFMESAARNFKERIKAKYPNLKELPNISTIHGLALRIIKENNNYSKLGLDLDFEIIDEIKRTSLIQEIMNLVGLDRDKTDLYDKAISSYKNELAKDSAFICENKLFIKVFELYEQKLKEQNLIDYDDLLLMSLKLLKENKDILEYYQNLVKVIIEDEAQDSSFTQQSLILLLGGKFNNIIRCGDINQAITSTFSNSDVKGFKKFIENSKNVEMDRCQRCATGVLDCANNIVAFAKENKIDAFSNLIMKPVENVNIVNKNAVSNQIFETEKEETAFVINKIQQILKEDKKASIAILLRNNYVINKWDKLLNEVSIKTHKNSDSLINNPVYKTCLLILEYILNPYDLDFTKKMAYELYSLGFYDFSTLEYVNNLKTPLFLQNSENDYNEQFFWDMNYFLYKNCCSIYELIYEIAQQYFYKSKEVVNIALVAAIAAKINITQKTFEKTVLRLKEIQYKNNFANIKFFSNDENRVKAATVQIMTLHKSKGDEFDYVFIPELTQDNLCLDDSCLKLKESSKFTQKVKKYPKTDDELKKEIVEENARLIYVGVTRAKKLLYLTSANSYKYFAKVKQYQPCEVFEGLEGFYAN